MEEIITYDKFGYCSFCHRNLLVKKLVNGKEENVLGSEYDEKEYDLSDGSKMKVAICKTCLLTVTDADKPKIMDSIIRGWEKELDSLPHWSAKQKEDYMARYSKLEMK